MIRDAYKKKTYLSIGKKGWGKSPIIVVSTFSNMINFLEKKTIDFFITSSKMIDF